MVATKGLIMEKEIPYICDRHGYIIEFCYQKHGHPNISKPNSSSSNATDSQSNPSSETPHFGLTQGKYDELMCLLQQANLIPSTGHYIGSRTNHLNTSISAHIDHSSDEPHQSGIPRVITCYVSNNNKVWLLDLGENYHICFSRSCFTSFYRIKPIKVHLSKVNSILVHYAGNVQFSPSLYITHVLHSPEFRLNLISI